MDFGESDVHCMQYEDVHSAPWKGLQTALCCKPQGGVQSPQAWGVGLLAEVLHAGTAGQFC